MDLMEHSPEGQRHETAAAQIYAQGLDPENLGEETIFHQRLERPMQPIRRPRSRLAEAMREIRASRSMTQGALSRKSGLRQAHLSQIEAGVGHPTYKTAKKLAHALGVPIKEFWALVCQSKSEFCGVLNNEGRLMKVMGTSVPGEVKDWYQETAAARGITMARLASEVLCARYRAERALNS